MKTTTLIMGLALAVAGAAHGQFFPERDPADVNGDGLINAADLAEVMGKWGKAEQPWAAVLERCPDPNVVTNEELRQAIVATGLPWRVVDIGTGIEMLLVPPGTFMMGCSASDQSACDTDEFPVHEVTLTHAFYLGRYEVTQAQWTAVTGDNPSSFQGLPDSDVRPVNGISQAALIGVCKSTGLRVPTEAEWEFAARAGTTSAYNNGSDDATSLGQLAWFSGTSGGETRPVGELAPNALGFHDMHGNVWEWVADAAVDYPIGPVVDPFTPATPTSGMLRGGSWALPAFHNRVSYRAQFNPSGSAYYGSRGVRLARTP